MTNIIVRIVKNKTYSFLNTNKRSILICKNKVKCIYLLQIFIIKDHKKTIQKKGKIKAEYDFLYI